MEKILQILAVFALLMLVVRGLYGSGRKVPPVRLSRPVEGRPAGGWGDLMEGVFGPAEERERLGVPDGVDAFLFDEGSRLLFCYTVEGRLTIYRRLAGGKRELQELSVPLDCSAMWWNPQDRKIFLEEGGEWFVYGAEGKGFSFFISLTFEEPHAAAYPFFIFIEVDTDHFSFAEAGEVDGQGWPGAPSFQR
jgi:hypothetical protein